MRKLPFVIPLAVAGACMALLSAAPPPPTYVPAPVYCFGSSHAADSPLCAVLPGNIGPDPALQAKTLGYKGIANQTPPASFNQDVESPFDNYSWQTFIALMWKNGAGPQSARAALAGDGERVWQTYPRVSQVFGNSPVMPSCTPAPGEQLFAIAAKPDGSPATRNEEYVQAATGKPAIDVNGNWTIYERRLNGIEFAYLKAPGGNKSWDLTTLGGQHNFVTAKQTVAFPHMQVPAPQNGAIEIKAAWRIFDPKDHATNAKRFYLQRAMLAVAPKLVDHPTPIVAPICAHVELGLVAMHIIQRNMPTKTPLRPQWFWTTFEQVDNAPLAAKPCDITNPAVCSNDPAVVNKLPCQVKFQLGPQPNYSYFNTRYPAMTTNQPPVKPATAKAYLWNPAPPYAKKYLVATAPGASTWVGTQISRCWSVYFLTQQLNNQWQQTLRAIGSPLANYMLIGTQWGAGIEGGTPEPGPVDAAPNYLSNSVVETYLQTFWDRNAKDPYAGFNTGSCVSCHSLATLTASPAPADLSFLPSEVNPLLQRREFMAPIPK